jgi:hypothetical protein
MTFRPWMAAALSLGMLAGWTQAAPPKARQYKVDVKTTQVVNLAALGQGEQRVEISSTGFVSVTATDSADVQAVTVVLDSLRVAEGSPIPPEQAKTAAGATWTGYREPSGRIKDLKLAQENPVAAAVEGVLQQLFPPLKNGTGLGKSWTDTTETQRNGGIAVRTVTNFQTSPDSYNGQQVLKLAGASSSSITGSQESPQGTVQFEGTGSATSAWFVAPDGTCLGSTYSGTQSLQVTVAAAPEPLPLTITTEGSASLIN